MGFANCAFYPKYKKCFEHFKQIIDVFLTFYSKY